MKRIFSIIIILGFLLNTVFVANAEEAENNAVDISADILQADSEPISYYDYEKALTLNSAENSVNIDIDETKTLETESVLEYTFTVPTSAKYGMFITYNASKTKGDIGLSLKIDGVHYFEEMSGIELPVVWTNSGDIKTDTYGNESAPEQVRWDGFVTHCVNDAEGVNLNPYEFGITEGEHRLLLEVTAGEFILKSISFAPIESVSEYKDYISAFKNNKNSNAKPIIIEGEDALYKTDKSLIPKSDNSDPSLSPASYSKTVLNTIGFNSWNSSDEALTWKFKVVDSGFYKIGFKFKQSESVNNISYRKLLIDGKLPFKEAESIEFNYGNGWQYREFEKEDETPYLIYLEKGEHTLSMYATLSSTAEYYRRLEKIVDELGDIYINVSMITGESPDKNRDYDLFRQIPDLNEKLQSNYDGIVALADEMNEFTNMSGSSMIAALKNMARVLKSMIDNPYTAQRYLTDYYTNYTSVGGWLYDMKSMPLSLDRIILSAPKTENVNIKSGFFSKLSFGIKRFISSFMTEYNTLGTVSADGPTIKIWVNWGRDQAEILGNMINDDFTAKTGINVKLEIVNAGIVKGILAGNPPDLSLHMARSEPVNLAMRDALCDLTEFEDFENINKRFAKTACVPYTYEDGIYALPDTQSFYIMYCRTDILSKLGIEIPKTWDEFIDATVTIQRNNMQVWLPYLKITAATTVNTGVGGLSLFPTLVHQNGLRMYNADGTASTLGEEDILPVFEKWTKFYTDYKLPKEVSFYNRFRIGTIPLGIEQYTVYQTLVNAAPEISEDWTVAEIPGVKTENGTINNAVAGSGTGCGIIKGTNNEEYAWEFLKWWTDSATQLKYSDSVETVLGTLGRVASANIEAVSEMSWKKQDLSTILSAWENVEEVEEVPGSYYLTRAVDQAYWAVVNGNSTPKEALMNWSKFANNEIERKIKEYSEG